MKIAVLVSGGVDSSVALKLLKDQGHDVTAFYIKIWLEDELAHLGDCPWEEDLAYVRKVCAQLEVPLEVVSLQREYFEQVVSYAIHEIRAGRTPNPDILCNSRIKFGFFIDKIDASFEKVASGHYAQVIENNGTFELHQAPDAVKDQTYFLSHLTQEQLARVLFPIGHLTKEHVRSYAQKFNLPNKDRKDSQGICFLGQLKFRDFVAHYCGKKPGKLIEYETGKIVGTHDGFWFYTIGQRHGIGLSGGPWYVVAKDTEKNIVYISHHYYSSEKERNVFTINKIHWIGSHIQPDMIKHVKLRHGAHIHDCTIQPDNVGSLTVHLKDRDQGIAPGQFAVLYAGSRCLGGGIMNI